VAAIVRNTTDISSAQNRSRLVTLARLDPALFHHDVLVPLFGTINRRAAVTQATELGAERF
jgi:hypothetical protein